MTETTQKKLPPNAGKGRVKGVPNKSTAALKEAILLAAEDVGSDGKGKGGLRGYLRGLARHEPKAFAGLLGKVLPMQVVGTGAAGEHVTRLQIEFVSAGSNPAA